MDIEELSQRIWVEVTEDVLAHVSTLLQAHGFLIVPVSGSPVVLGKSSCVSIEAE